MSSALTLVRELDSVPTLLSYVAASAACDLQLLREELESKLPVHMLPQLMAVAQMPLTVNGKIDVAALPDPSQFTQQPNNSSQTQEQPADPVQQQLLDIFRQLLANPELNLDSGFFHSGADSITAIQAVSAARQVGLLFSVADLFKRPSVRTLAPLCRRASSPSEVCFVFFFAYVLLCCLFAVGLVWFRLFDFLNCFPKTLPPASQLSTSEDSYPLTPLQQGLLFHAIHSPTSDQYCVQLELPQPADLDPLAYQTAWRTIVEEFAILRTNFVWSKCPVPGSWFDPVSPTCPGVRCTSQLRLNMKSSGLLIERNPST